MLALHDFTKFVHMWQPIIFVIISRAEDSDEGARMTKLEAHYEKDDDNRVDR